MRVLNKSHFQDQTNGERKSCTNDVNGLTSLFFNFRGNKSLWPFFTRIKQYSLI